jgi:hypothetical protein
MGRDDPDGVVRRQERRHDAHGNVISVTIVDIPETDDHPEGVKYAFHYGSPEGETSKRSTAT